MRRKTQEEFVDEMSEKNPNVEVLGTYINNQHPVKCRCKICNHIWDTSIPINLLRGFGCPECFKVNLGNRSRMSDDEYIKRLNDNDIPLIPLEKYQNRFTPILHKCKLCNAKRKYSPSQLFNEKHCVVCQGSGIVAYYGVNSLYDTHPEIANMIIDKEILKNVTSKSSIRTDFICKNCGTIVKNKKIQYVVKHGLPCQKCADGISYPMKFVSNVLEQLCITYETEVVFKDWNFLFHNKKYIPRYDIVFDNYIIEVDGGFHKKIHSKSKLTLDDVKFIDSEKDRLALENNYILIRIDAYEPDIDYMKNSILKSKLSDLYNLEDIDWDKCHEFSLKSCVKEVCDIWNECDNPSVNMVSDISGYKTGSVRRWLKTGASIGLCNYDSKKEMSKNGKIPRHEISVICLNHLKAFKSQKLAAKYYNINDSSSILRSCKNREYSGGKDPKTNEKLYWMYYEDYLKSKEAI